MPSFQENQGQNFESAKLCFILTGNVIRADINLDSDHKSKGFGTVQFETATEAINAVCILCKHAALLIVSKYFFF